MSDLYWLTEEQLARLAWYFPKSHGKPRVDDRRVLSGIISLIGCAVCDSGSARRLTMSDLYWLTEEQLARLAWYFPKSHGKPRVDDRRVLSGIISLIGCAVCDSGSARRLTMSDLYWLTEEQLARLAWYFPKSHGKPRVDDRRVLSGIIFVNRNGLRWRDAPREYGPHKTLYNRWKRWGAMGVFGRMMEGLAAESADPKTVMIDATYLKAHRTASSLRLKKGAWTTDRAHQGWHEHEAACSCRCQWPTAQLLHNRWSNQRLYRCSGLAR